MSRNTTSLSKAINCTLGRRASFLRFHASLAYNTGSSVEPQVQKTHRAKEAIVNQEENGVKEETLQKSAISSILAGFNKTSPWQTHRSIPNPTFEVLSPGGLGATLLIKLPPKSEAFTVPGTAIAVSGKVKAERSTDGNILIATGRKLAGGQFVYHKFSTESLPGDVLISPGLPSDIAAIYMDGRSEYYVRKDAFLARGPRVTLRVGEVPGMGALKSFAYRVTGRGALIVSGCGAIHQLTLNAGDEYLVNPKHLIAWDAMTHPTTTSPLIMASPSRIRKVVNNITSKLSETTIFSNFRNSPSLRPTLENIERLSVRTRKWVFGGPEYLKLLGPGDFYLASRVEPVFGGLKIFTSPSIEEIDETQTKLTPPSTLPRPKQPPVPPTISYATVTDKGKVTFTESSPTLSTPLFSKRSALRRIVSGDGLLRWVFGKNKVSQDTKRE